MSSGASIGTKGVPRAERERQILTLAAEEFAARGYGGASVSSIAARAGISKPLVYQYFGSKDELYLACLTRTADPLLDRMERAEVQVDTTVASRVYALRAIFTALDGHRASWRLLYDDSIPGDGPLADAANAYRARITRLTMTGTQRFLAARGLHDADDAAVLSAVWLSVVQALVSWWLTHPQVPAEQMVERSARLLGSLVG